MRKGVPSTGPKKTFYETIEPYIFLLPALAVFIVFLYYPFARTIYLSTWVTDALGQPKKFVGLDNYTVRLFGKPEFWTMIGATFKFVLVVAFGGLIVGLITSLLTYNRYFGSGFAAAIYAMPLAIASAAASMAFRMIYHPTGGLINNLLGTQINWLGGAYQFGSIAAVTIWLQSGINFIFISAGLKGVNADMYESAAIDGANYWQRLFHITLPAISPTLFFQIIINIINAFQSFSQVKLLTNESPSSSTNLIVYAIWHDAFRAQRFETAAARSVVLFIIILIITLIQFSAEKRTVSYQ
ncbi:MAG: sugar ABC transporter permease [Clostridia bacterium]|nr:sugar ABC transporter permease [Clostridia bacterium]